MRGGEAPGHTAFKFNSLVVQRITAFFDPETGAPRWMLLGDAQESAHLVTLPGPDGTHIMFDISFQQIDNVVGRTRAQLIVETAGSYDQRYVDGHFKEFLEKVRAVIPHLRATRGIDHQFSYVAPLIPSSALDPRVFNNASDICSLYSSVDLTIDPADADVLVDHVSVVQIAVEHSGIFGESD
jgi:hypothetical protein